MIISRDTVRQAVTHALTLCPDIDAALSVVAEALHLPEHEVRECWQPAEVWCCEAGQRQGVQVCAECAEASRGYSAEMAPVREGAPA